MEKAKKILFLIMIASILIMCLYNRNMKEEKNINRTDEYNIVSFTINGKESNISFPKKDSGYVVNSVLCQNGILAYWDNEMWKLVKENRNDKNIKCTVDFKLKKQIN
ncbi:MAG: hypothetical protein E7158_03595 [Firmicutes bacterium]|nr:hypothetical protein [Bacillota bacterium]